MSQPGAAEVFRERVLELLKEQGVSISELARRVGTSQSGMSRILNGHEGVGLDRAERIADALGTSLAEILQEPQKVS